MRSVRRQQRVPYTPDQMFDLVKDVCAYPEFLHWCRSTSVEKISDTEVVATVEVGVGGVRKSFATRNTLSRPDRITMELVAGPFKNFHGTWNFERAAGGGCVITLTLDFEVTTMPLDMLFAALFEEMVRTQVSAFVTRADEIYG